MKKLVFLTLTAFLCTVALAQEKLPDVVLKSMGGKEVKSNSFAQGTKYTIISFWATWCKPCMQELDAISENYNDWRDKKNFKLIAVSIDDSRSFSGVKSIVTGRGWEFDVFIDPNQDLKRALNITSVPHTIIVNEAGEIVKRFAGYTPGEEHELMKYIQ
jgi:cytochrome c biogenesis protein CcmG, thiol:disulfide interchange protein DsbE